MRQRYRFFACPDEGCPKLRTGAGSCPEHGSACVEVILRREDAADAQLRAKHAAEKMAAAGRKVGEAAGRPGDTFGLGEMFRRMAEDIEAGRPLRDAADIDDEDDEDEDDEDGG